MHKLNSIEDGTELLSQLEVNTTEVKLFIEAHEAFLKQVYELKEEIHQLQNKLHPGDDKEPLISKKNELKEWIKLLKKLFKLGQSKLHRKLKKSDFVLACKKQMEAYKTNKN